MVIDEIYFGDFYNIMNRPLSECVKKINTKKDFCIAMVILAGIIEEDPKENTRRYDDMTHLCEIMAHYISVTNNGSVEIPLDIFCKLGVLAEDYDDDYEKDAETVRYPETYETQECTKRNQLSNF